uniref:Uncharacterized protein n=1 Tax=Arundo donax TaxID=35708 RepID=A0A0A9ALS7_ARUDO
MQAGVVGFQFKLNLLVLEFACSEFTVYPGTCLLEILYRTCMTL